MRQCGNYRKWYGGRDQPDGTRGCVCDMENGHGGRHTASDCGLEWGPGNENYANKPASARFHAVERIRGRQTTLQVLRERTGMSQAAFGDLIGRDQTSVSRWERGDELIPDVTRVRVTRMLRRAFGHLPYLDPHDLDCPWDEVLLAWAEREAQRPV